MKVKPEHVAIIKAEIDKVLALHNSKGELVADYQTGNFCRSKAVKDLQKRFCFDLLFATGLNSWLSNTVYTYANDEHLYTVLKSICPVLECSK